VTASTLDWRLPRLRPGALTVCRRNWNVWKKLIWAGLLMNFGEPFLYLLGLGFGLGVFIGQMADMPYLTFLASGIVAASAMQTASFEGMYSVFTRMVPQQSYDAMLATPLEVDDIIAIGRARSLYRLASSDSLARPGIDPPAVHYVVGSEIRIQMENRQVQGMQVAGQTQGVHLEPLQRRPQADTTQVDTSLVTDSLAIVDTVRAAVDTLDPAVIATRPDYPTTPRELGTAGRVRLSRPSPPLPSPDAPTRARTETQPWNRPWIR